MGLAISLSKQDSHLSSKESMIGGLAERYAVALFELMQELPADGQQQLHDDVATLLVLLSENADLQKLHDDLVDAGTPTVDEALVVGAMIEELDIYDLKVAIDRLSNNEDIKMVYENLTKGSRNHLRSFYKQITNRGGSYEPIYISQEEFLSIVNSSMEKGD